jgi:transposase
LTAFGLATEVGDWQRFSGATSGAYLGLVPSEASSGAQRVQGSITKTGNTHARRLQVEAAWHHRRPFTVTSKALRGRRDKASPTVRAPAPSWPTGGCITPGPPWTGAGNDPHL